jgi:phospholipid transport system substrate-binding protein
VLSFPERAADLGRASWAASLLLAALLPGIATAAAAADPAVVAEGMTRDLIDVIGATPSAAGGNADGVDAELVGRIEARLEQDVDFAYIARRVMGRPGRAASDAQRLQFTDRFRTSLVRTYARTMTGFRISDLRVLDTRIDARRPDRASVQLEVSAADGLVYPLAYSMALTEADGWKVRNVTVNGINLGLTLARQFERALQGHTLDEVIQGWPNVGSEDQAALRSDPAAAWLAAAP